MSASSRSNSWMMATLSAQNSSRARYISLQTTLFLVINSPPYQRWHVFSDPQQQMTHNSTFESKDAADISSCEWQIAHCYHNTMFFIHLSVGVLPVQWVGISPDHNTISCIGPQFFMCCLNFDVFIIFNLIARSDAIISCLFYWQAKRA
jgi:hypothetical protein